MHIALFGGAFDPPHLGHLRVAQALLQQHLADEVWFVPVKQHNFAKQMSATDHRIKMLEILLAVFPKAKIELYETRQVGTNYTFHTLQALTLRYPDHTFSFVIGSDNVENFSKWEKFETLLSTWNVWVYPRQGSENVPLLSGMKWIEGVQPVTVSSTQVRAAVAAGDSLVELVDPSVERYIREHDLYLATQ